MINIVDSAYVYISTLKHRVVSAIKEERGEVSIIAIIIILAIALALAVIFRDQIGKLFNNIWDQIWKKAGKDGSTWDHTYSVPSN